MKAKQKKEALKVSGDFSFRDVLFWIIFGITSISIVKYPFDRALFNGLSFNFEGAIYSAMLLTSLGLIILVIYLYVTFQFNVISDLLRIGFLLIPISYFVSTFYAVSPHYSKTTFYLYLMYSFFFLVGIDLCKKEKANKLIKYLIVFSGYYVVIYGYLNMFGILNKKDAIMVYLDELRVTSVFQYANTYAAFLISLLLGCLYFLINQTKWYYRGLHGLMLVPIILSFYMTLSRGAIVLLPLILLFIFPLLKLKNQVRYIVYILIGHLFSFLIIDTITKVAKDVYKSISSSNTLLSFFDSLSIRAWLFLIVSSFLCSIIVILFEYLLVIIERKCSYKERTFHQFIIPSCIVIMALIGVLVIFQNNNVLNVLPDTIKFRVEQINFQQNSLLERKTFYTDALKVIKDHPFGVGGNGWAAVYEKYQNNPYVSRQTHNFLLGYIIDVGIIGFIIFALLILMIFYFYIKQHFSGKYPKDNYFFYYSIIVSLLIHGMIDFDFSFAYISIIFFLCLGAIVSSFSQTFENKFIKVKNNYLKYSFLCLLLIFSLLALINAVNSYQGNKLFMKSLANLAENKDYNEVMSPLDQAISKQSNHPEYVNQKINILLQVYKQTNNENFYKDSLNLALSIREKEKYNRALIESCYNIYILKNQKEQALNLIDTALINAPWEISFYERKAMLNLEIYMANSEKSKLEAIKDVEKQVLERTQFLKTLPEGQIEGRYFGLTSYLGLTFGKMYYVQKDYSTAVHYLNPIAININLNEYTNVSEENLKKEILRWYLASLIKQNGMDLKIYDQFINKYPEEKIEIERLTKL